MFKHCTGWKHDKVYIRGLQIKGKLKIEIFLDISIKKEFEIYLYFIMKSFFFALSLIFIDYKIWETFKY
jgi:hypothetical protein